jgi:hypothetical protein
MNSNKQRNDYPVDEAISDLEFFFKKNIKDFSTLNELLEHLQTCKDANRIGFRYIHERLMKYRKDSADYFLFSDSEKKMIDDLFYFFG